LRPDVVAACSPYVLDAVITGQDKPFAGALIWPSPAVLASLGDDPFAKLAPILKERLQAFNASAGGTSRRIGRFTILRELPSIDAGEITDKGYVNQRAALERRRAEVDALYAQPPGAGVVAL
jgi:feruloyl-CoA synthase